VDASVPTTSDHSQRADLLRYAPHPDRLPLAQRDRLPEEVLQLTLGQFQFHEGCSARLLRYCRRRFPSNDDAVVNENEHVEAIIRDLVARKDAARGSAEYRMLVRQLIGIREFTNLAP
jgi:hypothetical protein